MKCLFNMKMSEGGFVADHLNKFNTLTSQLSSVKVKFDDEVRSCANLHKAGITWSWL